MMHNHRATIQERRDGDDWTHEQTEWRDVADIFVGLRPMNGRELSFARQIHPTASYRVEATWHDSILPGSRLRLASGRVLEIDHVSNLDERNRTALLTCTETV